MSSVLRVLSRATAVAAGRPCPVETHGLLQAAGLRTQKAAIISSSTYNTFSGSSLLRAHGTPGRKYLRHLPQPSASLVSTSPKPFFDSPDVEGRQAKAYLSMARPGNLIPSMLLVFLGAWAGTGRSLAALMGSWSVWLVSFLSSSVAAASMIVNDYFDWYSGADAINSPQKPLPSGLIAPDAALLLGATLYIVVLMATCFMEQSLLRTVIALSAAATLLYTPLLKRLTGVKNATVAAVITASPLAGALAAGASSSVSLAHMSKLVPLCAFLFLGITYREVLMDVTDEAGDRLAGVNTIPVVAGRQAALVFASLVIAAAFGLLVHAALHGHGLMWAWTARQMSEQWVRSACLAAASMVAYPIARAVLDIWRANFDKPTISQAIESSMKSIGIGLVLMAAIL